VRGACDAGRMPVIGNDARSWIWWDWVWRHTGDIYDALREHVVLTALTMLFGLLVAVPLALVSWRSRRAYHAVLFATGLLYTIPSLALFAFLIPVTGLSRTTALVPLVSYTLLILVRNMVTGLDSVPPEVREAATGMGYSPARRLVAVDVPLALPAIVAGIRIATVSTIGLVTVAALVGQGGLGRLILQGLRLNFSTPLVLGVVLSAALAVAADLLLLGLQRALMPWARRAATR
jgi:osmoprotectant transport system permease protein